MPRNISCILYNFTMVLQKAEKRYSVYSVNLMFCKDLNYRIPVHKISDIYKLVFSWKFLASHISWKHKVYNVRK